MLRPMHDVIPRVARSLPCATAAIPVLALHAQAFPIGSYPGEAGVRRWVYNTEWPDVGWCVRAEIVYAL